MKQSFSKFRECFYCHSGCGKDTFQSSTLPGQYCTQDCYIEAMCDYMQFGLKGKFDLETDGHGGVLLTPTS